jgi:carboxypeptidase C (cathepsin A)
MRVSHWIPLLPAVAALVVPSEDGSESLEAFFRRQLPEHPTGVKTIKTANNVTIRYKEPGKEGVCETTPGVNSYAGYVDLSPTEHTFFWFFEARHDPEHAPITLWLNGGPGSDSLIGLFEELGPCGVNEHNESYINKNSWSEVSNMLFISQPLGVGTNIFLFSFPFSYTSGSYNRRFLLRRKSPRHP